MYFKKPKNKPIEISTGEGGRFRHNSIHIFLSDRDQDRDWYLGKCHACISRSVKCEYIERIVEYISGTNDRVSRQKSAGRNKRRVNLSRHQYLLFYSEC